MWKNAENRQKCKKPRKNCQKDRKIVKNFEKP